MNSSVNGFWRTAQFNDFSFCCEGKQRTVNHLRAEAGVRFKVRHAPIGAVIEQLQQSVFRCHGSESIDCYKDSGFLFIVDGLL